MANTWQLFAQCSINCLSLLPQYVPMVSFGSLARYRNSPRAEWQPRTQRPSCSSSTFSQHAQSHSRSQNLGTQNCRQKFFMGILDHVNIFMRKFKTQRFPDLRYILQDDGMLQQNLGPLNLPLVLCIGRSLVCMPLQCCKYLQPVTTICVKS